MRSMTHENIGRWPTIDLSSYISSLRESLTDYAARARQSASAVAGHIRGKRDREYPALEAFARLNRKDGPHPLAAFVPAAYGGRGQKTAECLSVLEELSYTSLPLSLIAGINGALFLQPLARYGSAELQQEVYHNVISNAALSGLMITEPDFGSDALSMQTSFTETEGGYRLQGTKHWGGLTGHADYWLITARERSEDGRLGRNINFFVWDRESGGIEVEEYYQSLGLEEIPYGRNRIDTLVPAGRRLTPLASGVRMLLDVLHRSRLQFPGMAMGFLRRILDEAREHVTRRHVGGRPLGSYDQVRDRLAEIEAAYTTCSAMCAYTSEEASIDRDCSPLALPANAIKTVVTDMMQAASQSLLQLTGAAGYRRDSYAGRAIVDCRPFQIFEGSNDILYEQVAEFVLKDMRRGGTSNLGAHLRSSELTRAAGAYLGDEVDVSLSAPLPQRKLVMLGQALSRVVGMNMVATLGERGFNREMVTTTLAVLRRSIMRHLGSLAAPEIPGSGASLEDASSWRGFLSPGV